MWVSRPGLGLETDQDHFLRSWSWSWSRPYWSWSRSWSWSRRVVLSKTWCYVQPQRYLYRKSKLASECAPLFTYLFVFPHLAVSNSYLICTTTLRTYLETWSWSRDRSRPLFWGFGLGLGLGLPVLDNISATIRLAFHWDSTFVRFGLWRRLYDFALTSLHFWYKGVLYLKK